LGAGSCALELNYIVPSLKEPTSCVLECSDINEEIMATGRELAAGQNIAFKAMVMDINDLRLDSEGYDIIMCWASLHHFVNLDHIAAMINKGLKPGGLFISMDICSRNGFRLWPETKEVVEAFWEVLPRQYRVAHTIGPEPVYCDTYPDMDCSKDGFECIRSEDVIPSLERNLERIHLIFAHTLARRFFDSMFGPNFDMNKDFDRSFFKLVTEFDELALRTGRLRPETFFGVYRKKMEKLAP
jgi:SAM-dependent methyltransferase